MDWKRLEDAFTAAAQLAIEKIMRKHPAHRFYGVALHESYRELDGQITMPYVATNSIECLPAVEKGVDLPYDYNPADWRWRMIPVDTKEIKHLHATLEEEANRSTQDHWRRTEKRFLATMVRVAKRLYAAFKDHPQTTSDFIVYFDDEDGDIDLIRASVPKRLFVKHFKVAEAAASRERGLAALSVSQLLAVYMKDLWKNENKILKLGEAAVDPLIAELKHNDHGWNAASLLGRIGIADGKVVRALRREVHKSSKAAKWSANALGLLGDGEYLLKLTDDDARRENAISGIATPLQGWADEAATHIPLDYRLLERVFEKQCQECNRFAKKQLMPGVSFCQIKSADVDEAIRGLQSPHVVIRQHAVCVLGERSLGKAAAKRILPALVGSLSDPHPNVRRLALLSISDWKAAAKPYRGELRKLLKDSAAQVRSTAKYVLS